MYKYLIYIYIFIWYLKADTSVGSATQLYRLDCIMYRLFLCSYICNCKYCNTYKYCNCIHCNFIFAMHTNIAILYIAILYIAILYIAIHANIAIHINIAIVYIAIHTNIVINIHIAILYIACNTYKYRNRYKYCNSLMYCKLLVLCYRSEVCIFPYYFYIITEKWIASNCI